MQINYKQKGRQNSNKNIDAAAGCRRTWRNVFCVCCFYLSST